MMFRAILAKNITIGFVGFFQNKVRVLNDRARIYKAFYFLQVYIYICGWVLYQTLEDHMAYFRHIS